jgi:energy-coupling factor transporter ATP-binding protein EcfA2
MADLRAVDAVEPAEFGTYDKVRRGGAFILDTPADPVPLWGDGRDVLWAEGESLVIAGRQGVGKSTLAQQLALGCAGFEEHGKLLGYPVSTRPGKVLYLAMDRPRQIARSMRRMVGEAWRDQLDDQLLVWPGPPMYDMAKFPGVLKAMVDDLAADYVIVDSIKDAAIGLTEDEVGASWNRGRQLCLAAGAQLIELHHQRKTLNGAKASTPTLDDLYGSTWITTGAGSVLLLAGNPGDPIVSMHHLKQPAGEVGPIKVFHDHDTGRSTVWHATDLVTAAGAMTDGVTAVEAARLLYDAERPTPSQKEKARRKLDALVRSSHLVCEDGDPATKRPTRWRVI